jgi:hypothetical protein
MGRSVSGRSRLLLAGARESCSSATHINTSQVRVKYRTGTALPSQDLSHGRGRRHACARHPTITTPFCVHPTDDCYHSRVLPDPAPRALVALTAIELVTDPMECT